MNPFADQRDLMGTIQGAFDSRGLSSDVNRKKAYELFLSKGFPGMKSEEYKYTRIGGVLYDLMRPNSAVGSTIPDAYKIAVPGLTQSNQVVFVNGHYSKERSKLID